MGTETKQLESTSCRCHTRVHPEHGMTSRTLGQWTKLAAALLTASWLCMAGAGGLLAAATQETIHPNQAEAAGQALGYSWAAPALGSVNSLGNVVVNRASLHRTVFLLSPSIQGTKGVLVCRSTHWSNAGKELTIAYAMGGALVRVTLAIEATSASLQATIDADQPVITSVDLGSWSPELRAKSLAVPYYTGDVWYLPEITAYANAWWDWHATHASRLHGTAAQYLPRTDATLSRLHEQLTLIFSPDVNAALPAPGNPNMAELPGRLMPSSWNSTSSKSSPAGILTGGSPHRDTPPVSVESRP